MKKKYIIMSLISIIILLYIAIVFRKSRHINEARFSIYQEMKIPYKEENSLILTIDKYSDEEILGFEKNTGIIYKMANSKINIVDTKNNPLSWDKLKDAKTIKIYYLEGIKEVSPALFNKVSKIVTYIENIRGRFIYASFINI